MKKYTVILDDGYYMEIMADSVMGMGTAKALFVIDGKTIATVNNPRAVIEDVEPDGYWFRHL